MIQKMKKEEVESSIQELQEKYNALMHKYNSDVNNLSQKLQSLEMLNSLNADLNRGASLDFLVSKARQIIIDSFDVTHIDVYMASEDGLYLSYSKEKIRREYITTFERFLPVKIPDEIKISLKKENWYSKAMAGNEIKITASAADLESVVTAFIEGNYESMPFKKYLSKIVTFFKNKAIVASLPLVLNGKKIALLDINFKHQPTGDEIKRIKAFAEQLVVILGRKQAEMTIIQQNQELKKLNADKDRFLSVIAHDLRNPFNAILGLTGILIKNLRNYDIDRIEYFINHINTASQSTYRILDDLLTWALTQSDKIAYEPQKLNLKNICNETIEFFESNTQNKKISINLIMSEDIYLFSDSNILKIILRNLISNAIKFTNTGGKVDILAKQDRKNIIVTISDNGVGIEPERLLILFDSNQIYSTNGTDEEAGTGLGLVLCKELLEKHKGTIRVESQAGQGSNFIFTLPILDEKLYDQSSQL